MFFEQGLVLSNELLRFALEFVAALVSPLDLLLPHVLLALEDLEVSGVVVLAPVQLLAEGLDLLLVLCFVELVVVRGRTELMQSQVELG